MNRLHARKLLTVALLAATAATSRAARAEAPVPLTAVPIERVRIDDPFWSPKRSVWRDVTIKDCLDKFDRDGVIENFDRVAKGEKGGHRQAPWFDGLLYEMIRASADFMRQQPDDMLKARIDGYVDHIAAAAAADPDGYINTYTTLEEPTHRWGANGGNDRFQHDLYNAGCLAEAAAHYHRATGDTKLLAVAAKMANLMAKEMGAAPKKNIIPGHAIAEESFVKMYRLFRAEPGLGGKLGVPVNEEDYLTLAKFWLDARGNHAGRTDFGAYDQDHVTALGQTTMEGHAVRAPLMAQGMVAVGQASGDARYVDVARKLWENMVARRMYVTGGVGSFASDEKFGADYVLPNDGYCETCAAVANGFLDRDLNLATGDAATVDELERSLYNGALSGVSLAGNSYFYENPLEAGKGRSRWNWHACPCCPPMFLKTMGAMPGYIYATDAGGGVYVNLFVGSRAKIDAGGTAIALSQETEYPREGNSKISVETSAPATFDLYVRVPAWTKGGPSFGGLYDLGSAGNGFKLSVNGKPVEAEVVRGYAKVHREWKSGDTVEVAMDMPVRRVRADARVEADKGRVALMRGPVVYCLESPDNGGSVRDLFLPDDAPISVEERPEMLGGVTVLRAQGRRRTIGGDAPATITAIPYYANANRGPVEMQVWLPNTADHAAAPSLASLATPSASHCFNLDTVAAMNDGGPVKNSNDHDRPRFTWWDHRGTAEWAQYEFAAPTKVSSVEVYWWEDVPANGHCRAPRSWRLLYRAADGSWKPVEGNPEFGTKLDAFNVAALVPVETTALRIEAQLQPDASAGILQWRVR